MGREIDRVASGKYAPGVSGNPGGRPKLVREVVELARQHTEFAIEQLVEIARDGRNEMARVKALELLLNRAHGSPVTEIELEQKRQDDDGPWEFTFNVGRGTDEIIGELVGEDEVRLDRPRD